MKTRDWVFAFIGPIVLMGIISSILIFTPGSAQNIRGLFIAERLGYIKDPRTNICFATFDNKSISKGSTIFTYVPCESVPVDLLITPVVK